MGAGSSRGVNMKSFRGVNMVPYLMIVLRISVLGLVVVYALHNGITPVILFHDDAATKFMVVADPSTQHYSRNKLCRMSVARTQQRHE